MKHANRMSAFLPHDARESKRAAIEQYLCSTRDADKALFDAMQSIGGADATGIAYIVADAHADLVEQMMQLDARPSVAGEGDQ